MSKVLVVLGGIFLALVVVVGGMLGFAFVKGRALDAESKAYVEETFPKILPKPNAEHFQALMAAEDRGKINVVAADQFALKVQDWLGHFHYCNDIKGDSFQNYTTAGVSITAKYSARCRFEKGSITAVITARKIGDAWSLMAVKLDDTSFSPNHNSVRADTTLNPGETSRPRA